jgi:NAD(P)-dependent dehydrogenase (short-subunit alcohol dehydrogenase family)
MVTGAARGLGLGFAQAIAKAGATVVMADILTELVEQEAKQLQQQGLVFTLLGWICLNLNRFGQLFNLQQIN